VAEGFRLRVRYGKTGRLRFLSHLEVMRACERSVRRAGLPYSVTQGFSPKMKVAFGPALPVGTAGEHEYFDVWLSTYAPAHQVLKALTGASPADLAPQAATYAGDKERSLSAALTIAKYRVIVEIPARGSEEFETMLAGVVGSGTLAVEHKGKHKVFELSRALPEEPRVSEKDGFLVVEITTRIGQEGSLRPEALVHAALQRSDRPGSLIAVTRTDLLAEAGKEWLRPMG
jgi:radical SAM-linked protein